MPSPQPHRITITLTNHLSIRRQIPCSPTDTIGDFKKVAAVYIAVRPEAILLKRQGQRGLRDTLTLKDYEIGDGGSLDLEVGTGD